MPSTAVLCPAAAGVPRPTACGSQQCMLSSVHKHPGPAQAAPQAPRAWDPMPTASWDVPFMTIDCAVLAELWGDCGIELPKVGRGSPADAALGIWQKTFDIAR